MVDFVTEGNQQIMKSYHGTKSCYVQDICGGNIDVELGGGELGRGFYTGQWDWAALAWSEHKFNEKPGIAVNFNVNSNQISGLRTRTLSKPCARAYYRWIKEKALEHSKLFWYDMVESEIMGKGRFVKSRFIVGKYLGNQYKWESVRAQNLLNSNRIVKRLI